MHSPLPLNNLNTFAAAAEHSSFQDAAKVLFVTPSAVSHQVRNLERILGYPLFHRLDKGVRLTLRGEQLFADICLPLRQLHQAGSKALRGVADNSLALSVAPAFATGWLLPRLGDFRELFSEINLTVIATTELIDFGSDPFDAAIRMGSGHWEKTSAQRLFNSEMVAVCHPRLLGQSGECLSVDEVLRANRVQNASAPYQWRDWFRSAGIESTGTLDSRLEVQGSAQVVEAIQSGECIGLVDRNFIRNDVESGRLVMACDHVMDEGEGYFLVYPQVAQQLHSLQCFRDWLATQLPTLNTEPGAAVDQ